MSAQPSDEDVACAVAFADGALPEPERTRFELRMAAEPELAEAVESMLAIDEALRRRAAARTKQAARPIATQPAWRRPVWIAAIAAALVAAFVIGLRTKQADPERRASVEVALLPSFESAREYVASSPSLRGLRPPGLEVLRSGAEEPNVDAAEFAAIAREHEEQGTRDALADVARRDVEELQPITAGYFVVPFRTLDPRSVVVVAIPQEGASQRLLPAPGDVRSPAEQGRYPAGTHVLPQERFELVTQPGEDPSIAWRRGFLVPVGARELEVLFATRRELLDATTIAAIDAALARGDVRAELERRGFHVSARRVVEPKN